ncbi:hypothetical protein LV84_00439 [Algoriphagus ratkowskyi]|uniref:Uncharacterized protein n=1 Tax=Algoriphagus ratkowskyi TaxID=57028 RepID=A0A2W7RZZ5_9BACT|nr:hypothetical protein LV84_00439 [Algoriphagus ratkowskyi]
MIHRKALKERHVFSFFVPLTLTKKGYWISPVAFVIYFEEKIYLSGLLFVPSTLGLFSLLAISQIV